MKKVKLMFGMLLVALFVSTIVLSANANDEQALKKEEAGKMILPTNG